MPKVTQAISSFLTAKLKTHNGPDVLERYLQYGTLMETQVNVAAGDGFQVDGKKSTWTNGIDEWWDIRIPKNANGDPFFRDYNLDWPLDLHVEAIGATGWDWSSRRSRWVGFDFDSITGHAAGVGVSDEELERVRQAACALPWVEVRRSTGGNGLHLYVMFDEQGVPTENHTVHAALGRAVLGLMTSETGFDFGRNVDACGGNMWLWARKMTTENRGLELVKAAERVMGSDDLPPNWRDHVEVVKGSRSKIRVTGVGEKDQDPFEALASSRRIVQLDETHKAIIDELRRMKNGSVIWVPDYHLLQTHTSMLSRLMDERKDQLGLKGFFKTNSAGKDLGQPNCFLFPLDDGGFDVYRFSQGVREHESWTHEGWTRTKFNVACTLAEAAEAVDAAETKRGFVLELSQLGDVARMTGYAVEVPSVEARDVTCVSRKDGRIDATMPAMPSDPKRIGGWARNKNQWERTIGKRSVSKSDPSDVVRFVKGPEGQNLGYVSIIQGVPVDDTQSGAQVTLHAAGIKDRTSQNDALADAKRNAYTLVNRPFEPEYPAPGLWNRFSPQLDVQPADRDGDFPHYRMVLEHVGDHLTPAVQDDPWCASRGIETGADYLLHWLASVVQRPFQLLPMLYFYGPQNSGKSSFANMLLPLFTRGVGKVDKVFTRGNTFDGELAGIVLGIIEEANLTGRLAQSAYAKLKDLTTAKNLSIERKGWDAFEQRNCLHLIQFANEAGHCPILERDDTRIVVAKVDPIAEPVADAVMQAGWAAEAPFFVRALRNLKLSEPSPEDSRLYLPTLATPAKTEVIDAVARITGAPENEQSAAELIQRFESKIRLLADAGWFFKVTVADILGALRWFGERDLPTVNEFGTALGHMNLEGLYMERGRSKARRWLTIATRRQLWLEDHPS